MEENDFDGVFRFTNATEEDFIGLWNNKEYTFPAGTCCPIVIPDETLENIQSIRKKWAYKLAVREFYKGKDYTKMSKMGNGLPPTYDEKILEPIIQTCLKPLPLAKTKVRAGKKDDESNYKGSKAVSGKEDLNYIFREEAENAKVVGKMPDSEI